jgi:hypothetical protein
VQDPASAANVQAARSRGADSDRVVVAVFMAVYITSAVAGASGYDTARDVAEAFAVRELQAFPLHGPLLAGTLNLGPVWTYVLALPLTVHRSWIAVALFATALASLQFPLAYATGRRLLDRRLGLLWVACLALPGWGSFELVGFGHAMMVRVCTMLVFYALVRLAQERRPIWLPVAALAYALALHAHPSTVALGPVIVAVAWHALRDRRVLLRWSGVSLVVATLPFLPVLVEQMAAPTGALERTGAILESTTRLANLAHVPALLYALLVRGPRVIADAFLAWAPHVGTAAQALVVAIEIAGGIGFIASFRQHRRLALAGLGITAFVVASIAWVRPVTPFYMAFAALPPLAGLGALGLHRLCELAERHGARAFGGLIAVILLSHVATVAGIARAVSSGGVTMAVSSRIDIKQDDTVPPPPEPWLPAYAVDVGGRRLCAEQRPVVLHGTYAYLEDTYFGLGHRLHCGSRAVTMLGVAPTSALHQVGLAKPLWTALGWQPAAWIGGLGIAPPAQIVAPAGGHRVPDGRIYPPYPPAAATARAVVVAFDAAPDEVLAVSLPHVTWMPPPALRVSANGRTLTPLAADAISALYACRPCAPDATVKWNVEIESVAPEWIDIVTLAPPVPR